MALTPDDVKSLMAAFEASGWDELSVRIEDTTLELTRTGLPPATTAHRNIGTTAQVSAPVSQIVASNPVAPLAAVAATPHPGKAETIDGHRVTAPSLGLFWRSPQPGAPPFVEVGQDIDAEDTVCIVEVMKLMNHVKAGVTGTVVAIEPANGAMVEFGQLLVVVQAQV